MRVLTVKGELFSQSEVLIKSLAADSELNNLHTGYGDRPRIDTRLLLSTSSERSSDPGHRNGTDRQWREWPWFSQYRSTIFPDAGNGPQMRG